MNYHNITTDDMLNGDSLRTVLWVSGCDHHCPGCQNPETWGLDSGIPFLREDHDELIAKVNQPFISGITFSGGDPLHPDNCYTVKGLASQISRLNKTVWIYTGYTWEELLKRMDNTVNPHWYTLFTIMTYCDVLVDGPYIESLRDINLKWRGSSNQRVIDVQKTLRSGEIILHCD